MIVEDKHGLGQESVFEFKHIPSLSKTTKAEQGSGGQTKSGEVEKRNFRSFVLGCVFMCIAFWVAIKILSRISGGVVAVARISTVW